MNDAALDKALSKAGAPTPNQASKYAIGGNSGRAMHTKIIGQTGSGKTTWLIRHLASKDYGTKQYDFVVWAAPRASLDQAAMGLLRKVWGSFLTVVPCDDKLDGPAIDAAIEAGRAKGYGPCCCVFDDLLRYSRSPWLKQAYTNFRLRGISIYELSQQIFDGAKTSRLNCSACVIGKFALQREMQRFAAEITTSREKEALLTQAYRGITKRKHGFLIVMLDTDLGAVRDTRLDTFVKPLWDL